LYYKYARIGQQSDNICVFVIFVFISGACEFLSGEFIAKGVEAIAPTKISLAIRHLRNLSSAILEKRMRILKY
jgi:hypothetical protein